MTYGNNVNWFKITDFKMGLKKDQEFFDEMLVSEDEDDITTMNMWMYLIDNDKIPLYRGQTGMYYIDEHAKGYPYLIELLDFINGNGWIVTKEPHLDKVLRVEKL